MWLKSQSLGGLKNRLSGRWPCLAWASNSCQSAFEIGVDGGSCKRRWMLRALQAHYFVSYRHF